MESVLENVWRMQNELRNKEGITGIDAMHHILLIILSKSFTVDQCRLLNIPEEFAYETMRSLTQNDLFLKMYNRANQGKCLLHHIRNGDRFGYTKDIAFKIKRDSTLKYLYDQVDKVPIELLFDKTDLVGDIYEHFINREGKTMKDLGQYFTDRSLIRYLVEMAKPTVKEDGRIETVWDPAAGTGGFLIEYINYLKRMGYDIDWSMNKNEICGNDINFNTTALLKQNLYYSLRDTCGSTISMQDSLRTENDTMFDVILGNPPFGVKGLKHCNMNSKIKALGINGTKGEILFLQLAMTHLKENGRCCLVVPEGVLFNSTKMYKETRKYLMTHFNLKKVIKVGEGEFFKNTGVKTSVFFFERFGSTTEVEFIQVNKVDGGIQEVPLMTVPMEKIVENEYSLNMNLYKEINYITNDEYDIRTLAEVCHDKRGQPIKVKGENLQGDYPIVSGGTNICGHYHKYNREANAILLSSSGNAGYVSSYPSKLWASDCWSIHPNDETYLTNRYLYYTLKHIQDIIYEYQTGSVIKHIAFKDIKNLTIPIPPLSVQERIVSQLDNIYETEISQSKVLIEGLKSSIEAIMKNTMGRGDLQVSKVGEVCSLRKGTGVTKGNRTGGNIPYYASNGQSANSFMDTHNIEGQFILLAEDGGIGSIHYIEDGTTIWVGDHVHVINMNTLDISLKYMYLYLKHNVDYEVYTTGSVIPKLNKGNLQKIPVVVPPLEVQQEILTRIEPKEQLIASLQSNLEKAEEEGKAIMDVLFN